MLNVLLDLGVMRIFLLISLSESGYFVNGFVVNDVFFILNIWKCVKEIGYLIDDLIIIMNCCVDCVDWI